LVAGARERCVLVGLLGVEELEDPALLLRLGLLDQALQPQLRVLLAPLPHAGRMPESRSSASRAASCSAAFFERPAPTPSCSPFTIAAQVKCRSCGGPSTARTAYVTCLPVRASTSCSSVL